MEELHAAIVSADNSLHIQVELLFLLEISITRNWELYLYMSYNTLDYVYMSIAEVYKAIPIPHLGQSDHLSLFRIPKYMSLIKRVKPSVRTVKVWPEGSVSSQQHQFQDIDWSMFASQATVGSEHLHIFCPGSY